MRHSVTVEQGDTVHSLAERAGVSDQEILRELELQSRNRYTTSLHPVSPINPSFSPGEAMDNRARQSSKDKPIAARRRVFCRYCGQQYRVEDFDGGCKSCGAPNV